MGAFLYDSDGMLRFVGADQAAALAYAKLFGLARFTLLMREPKRQGRCCEPAFPVRPSAIRGG